MNILIMKGNCFDVFNILHYKYNKRKLIVVDIKLQFFLNRIKILVISRLIREINILVHSIKSTLVFVIYRIVKIELLDFL